MARPQFMAHTVTSAAYTIHLCQVIAVASIGVRAAPSHLGAAFGQVLLGAGDGLLLLLGEPIAKQHELQLTEVAREVREAMPSEGHAIGILDFCQEYQLYE